MRPLRLARDLHQRSANQVDPAASAWTSGRVLQHQRQVRRQRRLPALRRGDACLGSTCPGGTSTFTGTSTCDGAGNCVTPNAAPCFPYQCGANVCKNSCTASADCASPGGLHQRLVRPQAGRAGLRDGRRVPVRASARSGSAAPPPAPAPASRARSPPRPGPARNVPNGTADPQGDLPRSGAHHLRHRRLLRRQRRLPAVRRRHLLRGAVLPDGKPTLTRAAPATATAPARRRRRSPAPRTSATAAPPARRPAPSTPTACARHLRSRHQPLRQQEAPRPVLREYRRLPDRQQLRRRRLLQRDRVRDLPGLQHHRQRGNCANVPASSLEPHGLCATNPPCGNTGACDGAGQCQLGGTGVSCGTASLLRLDLHAALALQRRGGLRGARPPRPAPASSAAATRLQDGLHPRQRLRRAATPARARGRPRAARSSRTVRPAPRPTSASAGSAPTASAAAAAPAAPARPAT